MLALSSRPWLGFSDQGRFNITPLSYEALDHAAGGITSAASGLSLVESLVELSGPVDIASQYYCCQ